MGMARAAMVAAVVVAMWCTSALADQTINLDSDNTLMIAVDDVAGTASVTLTPFGQVTQSVTIGNAAVEPGQVVPHRFCKGCTPAYFVPAYDRSSTYGATTGIVAYSAGAWWKLSILPLEVAGVGGPDASGAWWLTNSLPINHKPHITRYSFGNDGILRPPQ